MFLQHPSPCLTAASIARALLLLVALAAAPSRAEDSLDALRALALSDTTAWQFLEDLTTEVGSRQVGSPAFMRAKDWALKRLNALGFRNVHAEPFTFTGWRRGPESASIVGLAPQKLAIIGLGGTVPTPAGGLEGEVALFKTYQALLDAPIGSLKGKIAVVTQPTLMGGYGKTTIIRHAGPSEAARRGAIAFMLRSLADNSTRLPHTGTLTYTNDAPKIPAAALSVPDAEQLDRLVQRGQTVRIHLSLASETFPAQSWNVVGEFPGASDEVILVSGHLDSWDVGTGATDDGAGSAIAVGAAHLAAEGVALRRTVRVVLFGGEEIEVAAAPYAADAARARKIVAADEIDSGSEPVLEVALPPALAANPPAGLAEALAPLDVHLSDKPAMHSGTDTEPLHAEGVPAINAENIAKLYLHWHHSDDDTLDKIVPAELNQNVTTWALVLRSLATTDRPIRP